MTYTTLLSTYTGPVTDAALQTAASAAWGYLLGQTLGRITTVETVTEELSRCFSVLIDLCHGDEQSVTSETVGDFKREYRDPTAGQSQLQRAAEVIRQYLGGTDLLFRGTEG
mgnify:CR=1 FL=1